MTSEVVEVAKELDCIALQKCVIANMHEYSKFSTSVFKKAEVTVTRRILTCLLLQRSFLHSLLVHVYSVGNTQNCRIVYTFRYSHFNHTNYITSTLSRLCE